MSAPSGNWLLFISSGLALIIGFGVEKVWIIGGIIGIIPAIIWVVRDLRHRTMGSDVLAVLALIGAIFTDELFAASVVAFMLASGRLLESWAEGQAERQLKSLLARVPRTTHRVDVDGTIQEIPIQDVIVGNRILVRGGEIVPTDGELLIAAVLDESALTGEPLPVNREITEAIDSGVVNAGAPFEYLATNTSEQSTYAAIIRLVESAQAKNSPGIRIANRWAMRFVPIALILAAGSWFLSGDVHRAIAVLVAATPCPLILAVPIAVVSGLSRAAKHGAIIKGGAILELLGRTEVVLLDKTGTLTHGGPAVGQIQANEGNSVEEILTLAASVDQYSTHVVAKSLVSAAHKSGFKLLAVENVSEVAGHKIQGQCDGKMITVGQLTQERPTWLTLDFPLIVAVSIDDQLVGAIGLKDPLRPESRKLISDLKAAGVKYVALVTGDRESTAREVAQEIGIENVYSGVTAEGKLEITRGLMQTSEGSVVVVGDGINDAPALAAAHVGVAMGARGASAASEAADVVIVEDSIDRLTIAITIAKTSRKKAIQAAGIGMGLSFIAMIAGALGVMSPSEGAITQEIIDVVAILWALTALAE
ncbi:MAG: heavy metal translocating P-type ATPase [Actinomycetes bacterium]